MKKVQKISSLLLLIFAVSTTSNADNGSYTLPFTQVNGLFLIQASVNDLKSEEFILDTGSEEILLNTSHPRTSGEQHFATVNGAIDATESNPNTIKIGNFIQRHRTVFLTDLNALETFLNRPIAGIIGIGIFQNKNVLIDYESQALIISDGLPEIDLNASVRYPLFRIQNIPVITVTYNDQHFLFGLDSGCSAHVLGEDLFDSLNIRTKDPNNSVSLMSHNKDAISLVTKVESDLFQKIVRQNDKFLVKDLSAINNELNIHLSGLISPTQLHVRYVFLNFSKSECILGLPFPKWSYSYASALD